MTEIVNLPIPVEHLRPLRALLNHAEVRLDWLLHDRDRPYSLKIEEERMQKTMDVLPDLRNSVQEAIDQAITDRKIPHHETP
jgi:hypothetical protein